jgi:hypothetical protein
LLGSFVLLAGGLLRNLKTKSQAMLRLGCIYATLSERLIISTKHLQLLPLLMNCYTALPAAMRYILKAESYDRKGQEEKLYCIA